MLKGRFGLGSSDIPTSIPWPGRKVCVEESGQGSGGHQRGMCLSGVMHSHCRGTFDTLLFIFNLLLLDKYAIKQLADPNMRRRTRTNKRTAEEQNL